MSIKKIGINFSVIAGLVMLIASMAAFLISGKYLSDVLAHYHVFYPYLYVGYLNLVAAIVAIISGILMFGKKRLSSIIIGFIVMICGIISSVIFVIYHSPWENDIFVGLPLIFISILALAIAVIDYKQSLA